MFLTVIFYIFVASTAIQLVYFFCFSTVVFSKINKKKPSSLPISVIICAKNEEKNLETFLPSILNQAYENFEIVLINDASSDETFEVMERFKKQNSTIKLVNVKNNEAFWGNKKYALTLGIKAASNEHLLFTDADCKPVSKFWISTMAKSFTKEKTIVLGYGKYKPIKKSFMNLLIRFETLLTAIQYFSYAKLGSPYMGVGRNLAYHKSEFFKTKGFIKHIQVRSGDDDLFIQEAATKINTTICLDNKAHTISNPPLTLKEWFHQKRRHVSTAPYYKLKHKVLLSLFFITKVFFYVSAILLLLFSFQWETTLIVMGIYYLTFMVVFGFGAKKFKERYLVFFLPILEFSLLIFQFSIFISNRISKSTRWK